MCVSTLHSFVLSSMSFITRWIAFTSLAEWFCHGSSMLRQHQVNNYSVFWHSLWIVRPIFLHRLSASCLARFATSISSENHGCDALMVTIILLPGACLSKTEVRASLYILDGSEADDKSASTDNFADISDLTADMFISRHFRVVTATPIGFGFRLKTLHTMMLWSEIIGRTIVYYVLVVLGDDNI